MTDLQEELEELESAEDFLTFFGVEYDASVVHVSRLHILQRYHDYATHAQSKGELPQDPTELRAAHREMISRAYKDFVESTPLDERVFKVLKDAKGESFVSLGDIEVEVS